MIRRQQTVLISGASMGIGLDTARGFLEAGDNVVLNARDGERLQEVAEKLGNSDRVALVTGNISDPQTGMDMVSSAVDKFNRVDILVNNAGVFGLKPFLENTEEDIDYYININLRGTYFVTQAVVRQLRKQGDGGSIVNIGTVLVAHPSAGLPATAALITKGGVHALTTALASELAGDNIRVNAVAPGVIRTSIYGDADIDALGESALLGRPGEVNETTEAIMQLAAASFTTGLIMPVDGGYVSGRA